MKLDLSSLLNDFIVLVFLLGLFMALIREDRAVDSHSLKLEGRPHLIGRLNVSIIPVKHQHAKIIIVNRSIYASSIKTFAHTSPDKTPSASSFSVQEAPLLFRVPVHGGRLQPTPRCSQTLLCPDGHASFCLTPGR